nr:CrcB family protein [Bacillus safensis]
MIVFYTAVAGGMGSALRFFLSQSIQKNKFHTRFPYSIILINLLGAAGLGLLTGAVTDNDPLLMIIGTGFFGGFTTFSTFSVEAAVPCCKSGKLDNLLSTYWSQSSDLYVSLLRFIK